MRNMNPAEHRKKKALSQWDLWVSAEISLRAVFTLKRAYESQLF